MKKNHITALAACILVSVLLFTVSFLLTVMGLIITGTIAMTFMISESAEGIVDKPLIYAYLGDDGRSFILKNIGNVDALEIHISIVPSNLEYHIGRIDPDDEEKTDCGRLIGKNRIILDYSDKDGKKYKRTAELVFTEDCEYDPTKTMIPLFR